MSIESNPAWFKSTCGKAGIFVDPDMSLGVFHDFLLSVKGMMVDRMVKLQKEEEALSQMQKEQDTAAEKQSCETDGQCCPE